MSLPASISAARSSGEPVESSMTRWARKAETRALASQPIEAINLVGPDTLTGKDVAAIWSEVLGRPIVNGSGTPSGFEQNLATFMPKWMAYEMRLMAERYVSDGMIPEAGDALGERPVGMERAPKHGDQAFRIAAAR